MARSLSTPTRPIDAKARNIGTVEKPTSKKDASKQAITLTAKKKEILQGTSPGVREIAHKTVKEKKYACHVSKID